MGGTMDPKARQQMISAHYARACGIPVPDLFEIGDEAMAETETEHTALPWKAIIEPHKRPYVRGADGVDIALMPWTDETAAHDVAFIVRACNSHDALLAVCEAYRAVYDAAAAGAPVVANQGQALDGYSELANYRALGEKCEAALALATAPDAVAPETKGDVTDA